MVNNAGKIGVNHDKAGDFEVPNLETKGTDPRNAACTIIDIIGNVEEQLQTASFLPLRSLKLTNWRHAHMVPNMSHWAVQTSWLMDWQDSKGGKDYGKGDRDAGKGAGKDGGGKDRGKDGKDGGKDGGKDSGKDGKDGSKGSKGKEGKEGKDGGKESTWKLKDSSGGKDWGGKEGKDGKGKTEGKEGKGDGKEPKGKGREKGDEKGEGSLDLDHWFHVPD